MNTYEHRLVLPAAALMGIIALVGGQLVAEHVLSLATPISVIINFIGGVYFIGLCFEPAPCTNNRGVVYMSRTNVVTVWRGNGPDNVSDIPRVQSRPHWAKWQEHPSST